MNTALIRAGYATHIQPGLRAVHVLKHSFSCEKPFALVGKSLQEVATTVIVNLCMLEDKTMLIYDVMLYCSGCLFVVYKRMNICSIFHSGLYTVYTIVLKVNPRNDLWTGH